MKKKLTKKRFDPSYGKRAEWIVSIFREIERIKGNTDYLADEFNLPQDYTNKLEAIFGQLKEEIKEQIQQFEITPEMVFTQEDLFYSCLDSVYDGDNAASDGEIEKMIDITQKEGYETVKIESLAEQIKFDEFMAEMSENPYQLKLIA